jgi:thiol-disulfide isomerase/thioredoxin
MNNKKIIIGFGIAFIIALNIYNIPYKQQNVQAQPPTTQQNSFEINIDNLNEALNKTLPTPVDITSMNTLMISFWATWCPSCHRENQIFNTMVRQNDSISIIGICVDKNKDALGEYIQKTPLNFPVANNTKALSLLLGDIMAVPTHFIIDVNQQRAIKTMGLLDENQIKNLLRTPL